MNEIDVCVGQFVRTTRQAVNMSEATLAALMGVSVEGLQDREKGAVHISARHLWTICRVFDVKPADIFADCLSAQSDGPALPMPDSRL